jgi:hypothetical protein
MHQFPLLLLPNPCGLNTIGTTGHSTDMNYHKSIGPDLPFTNQTHMFVTEMLRTQQLMTRKRLHLPDES